MNHDINILIDGAWVSAMKILFIENIQNHQTACSQNTATGISKDHRNKNCRIEHFTLELLFWMLKAKRIT